jgi:hypothetical protein
MSNEEIRGPWGTITLETILVDGPLGGPFKTKYIGEARYYLNGQEISEDEVRRLIESTRLPEDEQP